MKEPPTLTSTSLVFVRICLGLGSVPYTPVPQTKRLLVGSSEMAAEDCHAEILLIRRLEKLSIFTGL